MREYWRALPLARKRAYLAARDKDKTREQFRRRQYKRWTSGTPEQKLRIAARDEVRKARLRGDLVPGPCELAGPGCAGKMNAHHDDYTKPLDVRWLCRYHHEELHRNEVEGGNG